MYIFFFLASHLAFVSVVRLRLRRRKVFFVLYVGGLMHKVQSKHATTPLLPFRNVSRYTRVTVSFFTFLAFPPPLSTWQCIRGPTFSVGALKHEGKEIVDDAC